MSLDSKWFAAWAAITGLATVFGVVTVTSARAVVPISPAAPALLRVCADPNDLPYSNEHRQGFENKIAELVASDLGRPLEYYWKPQRRGFIRTTLRANLCDVVISMPSIMEGAGLTRPYYRSTYVFVSKAQRRLRVKSLDDPRLRAWRIGIQITGEDYDNPPAAHALAARGIVRNVRGYMVYGDDRSAEPQRTVIDAVAAGDVDVAIVWGPLAGYDASRSSVPMELTPVTPALDMGLLPFAFDISMATRADDKTLAQALDDVIARRRIDIEHILERYHVPIVPAVLRSNSEGS